MKITTKSGEVLTPRRSRSGVAIGEVEFSPLEAIRLGRALAGLGMTHRRLPGTAWGAAEILDHYGITKQTLAGWRAKPSFPEPAFTLAATPVWDADAVEKWHNGRQSTKKRPNYNGRQVNNGRQA